MCPWRSYHVFQGDARVGLPYLAESLERVVPLRHKAGIAYLFDVIAEAAVQLGDSHQAVQLYVAADALREAIGAPALPSLRERNGANVRSLEEDLGDEAFGRARTVGAGMTVDEAVAAARTVATDLASPP